jgi:hypothetical protein
MWHEKGGRVLVAVLVGMSWLAGDVAAAQGGAGAFRLGLHGGFYTSQSATADGSDDALTITSAGVGAAALGVDLGYAAGDYIVIGGRVFWQTQSISVGSTDLGSQSFVSILPYVEATLSPGSRIRPAFGGTLAYASRSTESEDGDGSSFSALGFGAYGGVHFFATETFSISPLLMIAYVSGSSDPGGADASEIDVFFVVELAGWIGGRREEPPAQTPPGWTGPQTGWGGSAPAPPQPQPPPPPRMSSDAVTGSVPLSQGTLELRAFWSRPDAVDLQMRAWGMQARFRDCTSLVLRDGAQAQPLERSGYEIAPLGRGVQETIRASVRRDTLESLLASPAPMVELCGVTWSIEGDARNALGYFLRRLREEAVRYGTLGAGGTPATPDPAPAPTPTPTAPPAAGDPELEIPPTQWGPPPSDPPR